MMIQVRARHKHNPALPDLKQNARVPDPFVGRVWALFDAALQFPASQRPDFVAAQERPREAWQVVEGGWPSLRRSLLLLTPFFAAMMAELRGRVALAAALQEPDPRTRRN